eukprot:6836885-Alexandrium_andersonii.AAC.1
MCIRDRHPAPLMAPRDGRGAPQGWALWFGASNAFGGSKAWRGPLGPWAKLRPRPHPAERRRPTRS